MILMLVLLLILPTSVGFIIKLKKPSIAKKMVKYLRPGTLMVLVALIGIGIYVKFYVIKLMAQTDLILLAACAALPAAAMTLCGIVAFLLRQNWAQIKTICIEVGVQNAGVPLLILTASLSQPDADIASVPPMFVSMATGTYLGIANIIHVVHKKCCRKKDAEEAEPENYAYANHANDVIENHDKKQPFHPNEFVADDFTATKL